ncbi:MAG: YbaB/EbfC family nucleoid-associated protein [bacterium]
MIDIFSLVRNIGKIESLRDELLTRLKEKRVNGQSGGGMVEVTCNGMKDVLDIKIEKGLEKDVAMLADLIVSAISQAQKKAEALFLEEIKDLILNFNALTKEGLSRERG